MSWVKLDDGFSEHPKILAAGPLGLALWACGLAYCNRQKARDGFIPAAKVPILYPIPQPMKVAARLVAVGLWEETDDGFVVHDYHEFQPSEDMRQARAEAGRRGGKRSGEVRRAKQSPKQLASGNEATAKQPESKAEAFASNPVPVPEKTEKQDAEADASATHAVPFETLFDPESADTTTARARKEQRACRIPADFTLTDAMAAAIRNVGCKNPRAAFEHFRNLHTAKGSKFVDWPAAWRTWVGNHGKYACPCQRASPRGLDAVAQVAEEWAAEGRILA